MNYDERLLASAPVATRAEKQEGYNIDLLDNDAKPNVRSTSATPPPAVSGLSADRSQAEAGGYAYAPGHNGYASTAPSTPWYKTRKWLIIFLIGGIAAVAAIVGGAVGGTVGHSKSSEPAQSSLPIGGGSPENGAGATATSDSGIGIGTTDGGGQATNAGVGTATTAPENAIGTTSTTSANEAATTGDGSHEGSIGPGHAQGNGTQ
ncbi:hypothetical protein C8Q80DRAFT_1189131 [Daedaleopsis nitida]|nr:hypothetical protein C8Q80DRAFT_1189131 [Daedaleopsis nitida]